MEIGMLWYDAGPAALKDRVQRAALYYSEKHGRKPNLCLVNPDMIEREESKFKGIVVRPARGVMPGHFWIGVDETVAELNGSNGKGSKKSTSSIRGSKANSPRSKSTVAARRKASAKRTRKK
jgi:hypothetical protein